MNKKQNNDRCYQNSAKSRITPILNKTALHFAQILPKLGKNSRKRCS